MEREIENLERFSAMEGMGRGGRHGGGRLNPQSSIPVAKRHLEQKLSAMDQRLGPMGGSLQGLKQQFPDVDIEDDDDVIKPVCSKKSIEYEKDEVILAGNFEFEPSLKTMLPKRRMLVYHTRNGARNCYIFHYHKGPGSNTFRCDKCARKNLALTAKWMVDIDGKEFLRCGKNKWDHICVDRDDEGQVKPVESAIEIDDEPQAEIIKAHRFELGTGKRTGREKSELRVFTSDAKTAYYIYNYQMHDRRFRCGKCRNKGQNLTIRWRVDPNGVEYLKLCKENKPHLCDPVQVQNS